MPKPPATPPHSDMDGVDRDQARSTDAAVDTGQDSGDLARAKREGAARPDYTQEESNDDRTQ